MYYIFIENGLPNGAGEAEQLDDNVYNLEVSEQVYNEYIQDPLKFCYDGNQLIENPEYEKLKQQRENLKRVEEIEFQLKELDEKRIRAICEDEVKDVQTGQTWLEYYNLQIATLRQERTDLLAEV